MFSELIWEYFGLSDRVKSWKLIFQKKTNIWGDMWAPLGGIVNLGGDHNATTWIHFLENSSQVFSRSKTRMQILVWFERGNSKLCYDDRHRIEMESQNCVICWVWCLSSRSDVVLWWIFICQDFCCGRKERRKETRGSLWGHRGPQIWMS